MAKQPPEKTLNKKIKAIDEKLKTSFILIRQDVDEIQKTNDAMRKYLKKKDKQYTYATKQDNKIRDEFREDVDEFTQKISQLKLALEAVRDIKKEVVIKKDLAQIEDRIKTSFKNDIEKYKEQVKKLRLYLKEAEKRISHLESGKVFEKKKGFFFKRKENREEK
jgi:predicted RNase H-like nuclease (RuvC/YqgF family)